MATTCRAGGLMLHWETVLKQSQLYRPQKRCFADIARGSTLQNAPDELLPSMHVTTPAANRTSRLANLIPPRSEQKVANRHHIPPKHHLEPINVHAPLPSARAACKEPLKVIDELQRKQLDPSGARTRLFLQTNPDGAKVGDVLMVRQKTGDPFAGVCISIRRRGVETGILLRGQLTRVGVEMWFKIYSPNVESIEVVQRYSQWKKSGKLQRVRQRPRRARLYYMRQEKHDRGSVEEVVRRYQRERAALGRTGAATGPGKSNAKTKPGNKKR